VRNEKVGIFPVKVNLNTSTLLQQYIYEPSVAAKLIVQSFPFKETCISGYVFFYLTFMAQLLICAECGMKQLKKHTNAVY
jgi:hypothetical protein